jgi:hypothetical protein
MRCSSLERENARSPNSKGDRVADRQEDGVPNRRVIRRIVTLGLTWSPLLHNIREHLAHGTSLETVFHRTTGENACSARI